MSERLVELRAILEGVRRRWARRAWLRAWTLGAVAAAAVLFVGLLTVSSIASEGLPLVVAAVVVTTFAIVSLLVALRPLRQLPNDKQIARYIEERSGGLDDVLVTAVERADTTPDAADVMSSLLAADAVRSIGTIDLDSVVSKDTIRQALFGATAGSVALLVAMVFFAPPAMRATHVVGTYLFPKHYLIEVTPGSLKLRAGDPLTITARVAGLDGGVVPILTVGTGDAARKTRMTPGQQPGEFTIAMNNVTTSFPYAVTAGAAKSADFTVTVIRPVRVERIDVGYEYPPAIGLAPQTETDSGDIYAPEGTKVRLTIVTDKLITSGVVKMADGRSLALTGPDKVQSTEFTIEKDGSYRIALQDVDGLSNAGETEYFVRVLDDRPPDVRILRPAGDKQVAPLEEVAIEAKAEDDYGVKSLDLVFKTPTGKETVVPLNTVTGLSASGLHTIFLEDLKVQPGDFVAYYARATDVARGRRSVEARSDIFFLEVKPYDAEFTAAQSQAMGGGMQAQDEDIDTLIAAQKDIIAATWKLDARSRKGKDVKSEADVRVVARGQRTVKAKTEQAAINLARAGLDPRRRRAQPGMAPSDDPISAAIDAMGRAAGELDRISISTALPPEMDALNQLMKAAAEVRRRQIQRMQAQGGGGNGNRQSLDLSTLFDQELRKQQQTNYETPSKSQAGDEQKKETDPLDDIRELARRQEALARAQKDLDRTKNEMTEEELKRQLEKLTRDQNELRQQAEELAKKMQQQGSQQAQNGQQSKGSQSGQQGKAGQNSGADSQKLRDVAEEMKNAAGDLKKQDAKQAGSRGDRAAQQLRELEQQMQGTRPDERRRALGDLQLEARQLADAERRLGNESQRAAAGQPGEDARRKLAAEQERLADRADRLGKSVGQMSKPGSDPDTDPDEQRAMNDAARELDKEKIGERMRQSAQSMRQGSQGSPGSQSGGETVPPAKPEELAKALDKVAEKLGAATGARDADTERLSSNLARTQELRDKLGELQGQMDQLANGGKGNGQGQGQTPAEIQKLQREIEGKMRDTQKLADEVRQQNPEMQKGGATPEEWQRSVSAPGTESFKQDFAKWESLKKNLEMALEQTESTLSQQLRARENKERLNAGRRDAVSDSYRELVDRYYQSLAAPRKAPKE